MGSERKLEGKGDPPRLPEHVEAGLTLAVKEK